MIKVVKKLYNDFKIEIKVGDISKLIDYRTGVKQGDNLVPILFIIVMQYLSEIIEKNY